MSGSFSGSTTKGVVNMFTNQDMGGPMVEGD